MQRTCPLCGASNTDAPRHHHSIGPWPLKECASCSMLYLEDVPEYAQLAEEFAWEKTFAKETEQRMARHPLLHRIRRIPKRLMQKITKRDKIVTWAKAYFAPGAVLDVGCAGGHTLTRLPEQYVPCGIEVSKALSERARASFAPRGGFVICADALSGLEQCETEQFTGVIMTAFLEHEVRPLAVLKATKRLMKPGARVIIKVPNYASWNRVFQGGGLVWISLSRSCKLFHSRYSGSPPGGCLIPRRSLLCLRPYAHQRQHVARRRSSPSAKAWYHIMKLSTPWKSGGKLRLGKPRTREESMGERIAVFCAGYFLGHLDGPEMKHHVLRISALPNNIRRLQPWSFGSIDFASTVAERNTVWSQWRSLICGLTSETITNLSNKLDPDSLFAFIDPRLSI